MLQFDHTLFCTAPFALNAVLPCYMTKSLLIVAEMIVCLLVLIQTAANIADGLFYPLIYNVKPGTSSLIIQLSAMF